MLVLERTQDVRVGSHHFIEVRLQEPATFCVVVYANPSKLRLILRRAGSVVRVGGNVAEHVVELAGVNNSATAVVHEYRCCAGDHIVRVDLGDRKVAHRRFAEEVVNLLHGGWDA
ncbi:MULTISPECIES: hypothetical protein [unclassified Micromonospora]|uniref:hypothetical protein n=1 Tax=unclassified Micromonospora TaxID=2617518 RepID=UPI003630AB72